MAQDGGSPDESDSEEDIYELFFDNKKTHETLRFFFFFSSNCVKLASVARKETWSGVTLEECSDREHLQEV